MFGDRHFRIALGLILCVWKANGLAISSSLKAGVCLCVNEPNVNAVKDPTNPSSILVTLSNGACFTTNGGIYHSSGSSGSTWYELRDSENGQVAWVDGFYLNVESRASCDVTMTATPISHHSPAVPASSCIVYGQTHAHGDQYQLHGLYCTCDDGLSACSATGNHCVSGGIVFREGSTFDLPGSGPCSCKLGTLVCNSVVG